MLGSAVDKLMDWTVVPGYTSLGYRVRERIVDHGPLDLEGRRVLVTGATSGIGEAACEELARAGAAVLLVARDREKAERAQAKIAETTGSDTLELHLCDVSSLASVRALAEALVEAGQPLHVLVNNAGMLPSERAHTEEGFELSFATNVLGPFLLTSLLVPLLRESAPARIVNVSSGGMYTQRIDVEDPQLERHEFDGPRFYAHAKRAQVILTEEWGRRLAADRISVHSMHPGWVSTPGIESSLPRFNRIMGPLLRDRRQGADTIVWLAGSPEAGRSTGRFWHDRRPRPKHRVPWTRENGDERRRLFEVCRSLAGLG